MLLTNIMLSSGTANAPAPSQVPAYIITYMRTGEIPVEVFIGRTSLLALVPPGLARTPPSKRSPFLWSPAISTLPLMDQGVDDRSLWSPALT